VPACEFVGNCVGMWLGKCSARQPGRQALLFRRSGQNDLRQFELGGVMDMPGLTVAGRAPNSAAAPEALSKPRRAHNFGKRRGSNRCFFRIRVLTAP
jgi:hypothetical protein